MKTRLDRSNLMSKLRRKMLESREKRRSMKKRKELETSESPGRRLKKREEKERDLKRKSGRKLSSRTSHLKLNFSRLSSTPKKSPAKLGWKELLLKMLKGLDSSRDRKKMKERQSG